VTVLRDEVETLTSEMDEMQHKLNQQALHIKRLTGKESFPYQPNKFVIDSNLDNGKNSGHPDPSKGIWSQDENSNYEEPVVLDSDIKKTNQVSTTHTIFDHDDPRESHQQEDEKENDDEEEDGDYDGYYSGNTVQDKFNTSDHVNTSGMSH